VIKHSGHLRTLEKCRKHSSAACVFYISLMFSNPRRLLSQRNTQLRLLYLFINFFGGGKGGGGGGRRGWKKGVVKITVGLARTSWSQLPEEQPGRLTLYFMTLFKVHVDAGAAIHRDQ